jgi:hypothetical protein
MLQQGTKKNKKAEDKIKERRERHLLAMHKYIHSPKGLATRQKYLEANLESEREYRADYMRKKRALAKKNKICIKCFRNKVPKGYVQCQACLEEQRIYHVNRRQDKQQEKKTLWQWFNFHQK